MDKTAATASTTATTAPPLTCQSPPPSTTSRSCPCCRSRSPRHVPRRQQTTGARRKAPSPATGGPWLERSSARGMGGVGDSVELCWVGLGRGRVDSENIGPRKREKEQRLKPGMLGCSVGPLMTDANPPPRSHFAREFSSFEPGTASKRRPVWSVSRTVKQPLYRGVVRVIVFTTRSGTNRQ